MENPAASSAIAAASSGRASSDWNCSLWRTAEKLDGGPVDACITPDGIVLRTVASLRGKPQVVFEATELSRAPQSPQQFELPAGVKVTRMPKGMQGFLPGIPGLNR